MATDNKPATEQLNTVPLVDSGRRIVGCMIDLSAVLILVRVGKCILLTFDSRYSAGHGHYLYGLVLLYYCAMEGIGGQTLGKMVLRTKAVTRQGKRLSFLRLIVRGLWRFLPLEGLLGLGRPTHDSLSGTLVTPLAPFVLPAVLPDLAWTGDFFVVRQEKCCSLNPVRTFAVKMIETGRSRPLAICCEWVRRNRLTSCDANATRGYLRQRGRRGCRRQPRPPCFDDTGRRP